MGLIIGQGTKSGGGGGGASSAEKALAKATTLDGRLYNLWEVLPQVKADPRASGYACIMLAEYWQGYNSLVLQGANAFLTCDGDFYQMSSTIDEVTHYWHDGNSGYMDRWVAFLFATQKTNYTPTSSATMPRNILVDGQLGIINTGTVVNRINNYWTTDGSSIAEIDCYATARKTEVVGDVFVGVVEDYADERSYYSFFGAVLSALRNIVINLKKGTVGYSSDGRVGTMFYGYGSSTFPSVLNIYCPILETFNGCVFSMANSGFDSLLSVDFPMLTHLGRMFCLQTNVANFTNLRYLKMPKLITAKSFYYGSNTSTTIFPNLIHIEFGQGFVSNLDLKKFSFANCLLTDSKSLVEDVVANPTWSNLDQWRWNFEHLIVDKLADLSGTTAKTITLAAAPYAAITESIRQKMSAKNWNLASA